MKKTLLFIAVMMTPISQTVLANKLNLKPVLEVDIRSTYLSKNLHSATGSYSVGVKKKFKKGSVTLSSGKIQTHLHGKKKVRSIKLSRKKLSVKHTRGNNYKRTTVKYKRVSLSRSSSKGNLKVGPFKIKTGVETSTLSVDVLKSKHMRLHAGASRIKVKTPFGSKSGTAPTIGVSVKF